MVAFFNSPDAGSLTLEVHGFENPNTRLNYIPRFEEASFLDELKQPGGGSVTLRSDDYKFLETPQLLDRRNIVKCRYGNKIISAFIVQKQEEVYVDSTEGKASAMTYSGESLKSWFKDAELYQEGGFKSDSFIGRAFSFVNLSGPWYKPADWSPAVNVVTVAATTNPPYWYKGAPDNWPKGEKGASWVWTRHNSSTSGGAPVGTAYFRYPFTIATSTGKRRYKLAVSVDDSLELFVDGQSVGSASGAGDFSEFEFVLSPGVHVIAVEAKNEGNIAGLLMALYRSSTAGDNGKYSRIWMTGQAGLSFYNKTTFPGWTVGMILRILLEEAEARGVRFPTYLTPTFTDDLDSNGVPWLEPIPWSWNLGTSYYEIIESLEEVQCETWIDPENYKFHVYVNKGRDLQQGNDAVQVRAARNISQAVRESNLAIKNSMLINANGLWAEQTHAESLAKYGRIEGYLQTELAAETSRQVAKAVLDVLTDTTRSLTIEIIPSEFAVPFLDFVPGDWISVTDPNGSMEKDRVVTLAVRADRNDPLPKFSIEMNTASEDRLLKLGRIISKLSRGSLSGTSINGLI